MAFIICRWRIRVQNDGRGWDPFALSFMLLWNVRGKIGWGVLLRKLMDTFIGRGLRYWAVMWSGLPSSVEGS
jgi:hypothetical protein